MSFDIFLAHFENGEVRTFKREIFDRLFGAFTVGTPEPKFMRVRFPDGGGADIYVENKSDLSGMMFNHCGGDAFYDALYELIRQTGSVVFWPGVGRTSVIADPAVVEHLPANFIESCGQPVLVRDKNGITDAIQDT